MQRILALSGGRAFTFGLCLASLIVGPALGQSTADIKAYQEYLTWTTDYEGLIDGIPGEETAKAIAQFQAGLGHPKTGQLSPEEIAALRKKGTAAKDSTGFRLTIDDEAAVRIGIPFKLVSSVDGKKTNWGKHWEGKNSDLSIDTLRFKDVQLEKLYDRLQKINNRSVQYARIGKDKDWFAVAAFEKDAAIYVRAELVSQPGLPQEIRGFSLWMSKDRPPLYQALAPAMLSSFSTTKGQVPINASSLAPNGTKRPPGTTGSGSGSGVREAGEITNMAPPPPLDHIKPNRPAPSAADCINGLGPIGCPLAFR